jgi:hypothetical protein
MCFSAEASFAGGVIISAIGIVTVTPIHKRSQLIFGIIPVFFGIQQIVEGLLWISLPDPELINLQKFSTYFFLVMAEVIWPTMIPLSVLTMEVNEKRRKFLWILLGVGLALSTYYTICLFMFHVTPEIDGYHILYNSDFPKFISLIAFFVYLVATITPLFISSIKRTHLMGILMFLSCAVSAILFTEYLTSVWCFFAAIISGVIFWILRDSKRKFKFDSLELLKKELIDPLIAKISKQEGNN